MIKMYRPWHVTAIGTAVPVFPFANTTASTAVVSTTVATVITPASMQNIYPYEFLMISGGTGTAEIVQVLSTTATTFTALFANTHSSTYTIVAQKPGDLGNIDIGNAGTNTVLTLYNGNPALNGSWGTNGETIGIYTITPSMPFIPEHGYLENQLFYTIAGTGFDITIWYQQRPY